MPSNRLCAARVALSLTLWCAPLQANGQSLDETQAQSTTPVPRSASILRQGRLHASALASRWQPPIAQPAFPRSRNGEACGKKVLVGLAVGAGTGLTYGVAFGRVVGEPGKVAATATAVMGLLGAAVGYQLCGR